MEDITEDGIDLINLCIQDIEMLIDGSWDGDADSAECTLNNLIKIKEILEKYKLV